MIDNQINIEEKGKLSEIANCSANSLGPADVVEVEKCMAIGNNALFRGAL